MIESLANTMNKIFDIILDNMRDFVMYFKNESDEQQRKMHIFNGLKKLKILTQDQLIRAAQILCQNHDQMRKCREEGWEQGKSEGGRG